MPIMLVAGRDQAFEFGEPVLDDIESSWVWRVSTLDDVKIAAVAGNVVGNAGCVDVIGLKSKLRWFPLELRSGWYAHYHPAMTAVVKEFSRANPNRFDTTFC